MLQIQMKLILFIILPFLFISPPELYVVQAEEPISNDSMTVEEMLKTETENKETEAVEDTTKTDDNLIEPMTEDTEVPTFETQFSWFDFVKMIFALAIVIGLIYFILKFVNQKNRMYGQARIMQNLGGVPLGTNRSIQLIKINDRILVVGVGESIQLLKEIDAEDEIEKLMEMQESPFVPKAGQFLNKFIQLKEESNKTEENNDFNQLLKEQLEALSKGRKKVYDKFSRREDQDE